jgi:hypothetical protein
LVTILDRYHENSKYLLSSSLLCLIPNFLVIYLEDLTRPAGAKAVAALRRAKAVTTNMMKTSEVVRGKDGLLRWILRVPKQRVPNSKTNAV